MEIFEGNLSHLPFPSHIFDRVFVCGNYYKWNNPLHVLVETYRILAPGGMMVTTLDISALQKEKKKASPRSPMKTANIDPVAYMHSLETAGFADVNICYLSHANNLSYQAIFAYASIDREDTHLNIEEETTR